MKRQRIIFINPGPCQRAYRDSGDMAAISTMARMAARLNPSLYNAHIYDEGYSHLRRTPACMLAVIHVDTAHAVQAYRRAAEFRLRGVQVVLWGSHINSIPEEAERHADVLLTGDAETAWPRLIKDLATGLNYQRYNGLPSDLRGIPLTRWDLVKAKWGRPVVLMSHDQFPTVHYRSRPVEEILHDVAALARHRFSFECADFLADHKLVHSLLDGLKKLHVRWTAPISLANCTDEQLLAHCHAAGCTALLITINTFGDTELEQLRQGSGEFAALRHAIQLIHNQGIAVHARIVFGTDHDGTDVFWNTLDACELLQIDRVAPRILAPIPGSGWRERLAKEGRICGKSWDQYDGWSRVAFEPRRMTATHLLEGFRWFREQFYAPKAIARRYTQTPVDRARTLIGDLASLLAVKIERN